MSKRKEDQPETNDGADPTPEPPAKKSRGRPRIHPPKDPNAPKRPRGRPRKTDSEDTPTAAAKRSPAKPRKQGKVVIRKSTSPGKKGRGRPKGSTKSKGRGRPPKAAKVEEPAPEEEEAGEEAEESS